MTVLSISGLGSSARPPDSSGSSSAGKLRKYFLKAENFENVDLTCADLNLARRFLNQTWKITKVFPRPQIHHHHFSADELTFDLWLWGGIYMEMWEIRYFRSIVLCVCSIGFVWLFGDNTIFIRWANKQK